jgi:AraC family transcriptional regulator
MVPFSDLHLVQEDGDLPTTMTTGSASGESGVSILNVRFQGGAHFNARPPQHLVWFQMSSAQFDCRIAGRTLRHQAPIGQLTICPAGIDSAADATEGVDALLVAVDPSRLTLAAAEGAILNAQLIECFSRFDRRLLEFPGSWHGKAPTTIRMGRFSGMTLRADSSTDWRPVTRRSQNLAREAG